MVDVQIITLYKIDKVMVIGKCIREMVARTGFEPARAKHSGFRDHPLGPGLSTSPNVLASNYHRRLRIRRLRIPHQCRQVTAPVG